MGTNNYNQRGKSVEQRFWEKVNKDGPMCERLGTRCWVWIGAIASHGYGTITTKRRHSYAHRVSWELSSGKIPDGLCVLHKCDNPPCIRPDHLFLGTGKDNTADMINKGRAVFNPPGERSSNHKLTKADVIAMRERYARGDIAIADLARLSGVERSTASSAINRKSWKSVK